MYCHACQAPVSPSDNFCSHCGTRLQPGAEKTNPKPGISLSPERRQLTVMFCDIVGSTGLAEGRDPEEFRQMIVDFQDLIAHVARQHDGFIAQFLGDGLLLYFGYPRALEDAALSGVRCGLQILSEVKESNIAWKRAGRPGLEVRIGIHTGLVVVDSRMAVGETTNLAARIQTFAKPMTLCISEATARLVKGWFELRPIGDENLKGFSKPVMLYEVLSGGTIGLRRAFNQTAKKSQLIGRDDVVAKLNACWEQSLTGSGKAVLISSEAGVGKSRLISFLAEQVALYPGARIIEIQCSGHHRNTAFYPISDLIDRELETRYPGASFEQRASATISFLESFGLDAQTIMPAIAEFFRIPNPALHGQVADPAPEEKRKIISAAITDGILHLSQEGPILVLIEDLHWADPSTLDWLREFSLAISRHPIFLVCSTRSDLDSPSYADLRTETIELPKLTQDESRALCLAISGGNELPAQLVEQIIEKTGGIPLFIEEVLKMVLESGVVVPKGGRYILQNPLITLSIPSTLRDSLIARLDMLDSGKEVVQMAAVIGKEFPVSVLVEIMGMKQRVLLKSLKMLEQADLIQLRQRKPVIIYSFKHALIRDAAYETLLKSKRQSIHAQVAEVIRAQFPDTELLDPELLAHHYTEAGLSQEALLMWAQAGRLALRKYAKLEALHHFEQARKLIVDAPTGKDRDMLEIEILISVGGIYSSNLGYAVPQVEEVFLRAAELCLALGDVPELFYANYGLASYHLTIADFKRTKLLTDQLRQTAHVTNDYAMALAAYNFSGSLHFFLGNFAQAQGFYEEAKKYYDSDPEFLRKLGHGDIIVLNEMCLSLLAYKTGSVKKAFEMAEKGRKMADEVGEVVTRYYAYNFSSFLCHFNRDYPQQIEVLSHINTVAKESNDTFWILISEFGISSAKAYLLDTAGLELARKCIEGIRATGLKNWSTFFYATLAEIHWFHDDFERAKTFIDTAEEVLETTGEEFYAAELYRIKAEIAHTLGDTVSASSSLHTALEIARNQKALSWELKCAVTLDRLHRISGLAPNAGEILQDVERRLQQHQLNPSVESM